MEKLGVQIDEEKNKDNEKRAGRGPSCPLCGERLKENTNVPTCPIHGTAPFESDPDVRRED